MKRKQTIKIKRIEPSSLRNMSSRRYSIEEIVKAAQKVKEAVAREEKKYGKLQFAS